MVGVELEALAKKFDRFGWDRDRNSPAHDRMITDWMDALQDYPLTEVQAACKAVVLSNPNRMPNEGHIVAEIRNARKRAAAAYQAPDRAEQAKAPEITEEQRARMQSLVEQNFPALRRMNTGE